MSNVLVYWSTRCEGETSKGDSQSLYSIFGYPGTVSARPCQRDSQREGGGPRGACILRPCLPPRLSHSLSENTPFPGFYTLITFILFDQLLYGCFLQHLYIFLP